MPRSTISTSINARLPLQTVNRLKVKSAMGKRTMKEIMFYIRKLTQLARKLSTSGVFEEVENISIEEELKAVEKEILSIDEEVNRILSE